jgi:very-short-patch-repair endonuclease
VFVKNLENVQGDERDVILFSVCYGPDASGRVSMNFGPLNRDGGERRLNVAITRARREVFVFSTLRVEQIDLARTRARGVADLKLFLDYAERGAVAMAEAVVIPYHDDFDSPFEQQVCAALRERGYTVHTQVGCSGYRIDLAVVDPAAPGRYLLGIECDGANYHRAKTARDRDRLREAILRGLGWQLARVWSSDWWQNPHAALEKIIQAIEQAKRSLQHAASPQAVADVSSAAATPTAEQPVPETQTGITTPDDESEGRRAVAPGSVYQPYSATEPLGTAEDFFKSAANTTLRRTLEAIVAQEGPLSLALAARRLAAHWAFSRLTEKVQQRVARIARRAKVQVVQHDQALFLWPPELDAEQYRTFRIPDSNPDSRRDATDLPPEEIANAMLHLLAQHISLPVGDLVRETARLFGYQRAGPKVEQSIRRGIDLLVARNAAQERAGTIHI